MGEVKQFNSKIRKFQTTIIIETNYDPSEQSLASIGIDLATGSDSKLISKKVKLLHLNNEELVSKKAG